MTVDSAMEVLIILVVIIAVMLIVLIVTIVLLVIRWRQYKARNSTFSLANPYSIPARITSLSYPQYSEDEPVYTYVSPNSFSHPVLPFREPADNYITQRTEEVARNSMAGQIRHHQMNREPARGKTDSMRSSQGVDLGGNYNKAWTILGRTQRLDI